MRPKNPLPQLAIYDEHDLFKTLLHEKLINSGYSVAFSCNSPDELFTHLKANHSVLVINGDHVREDSLRIIRNVHKQFPALKILVYLSHDTSSVKKIFLRAGSNQLVSCCADVNTFLKTLADILPPDKKHVRKSNSDTFYSDNLAFQKFIKNPKYFNILKCLEKGMRTKEIASHTGIPESTVKTYKKRFIAGVNCKSTSDLMAKAKDHKMI